MDKYWFYSYRSNIGFGSNICSSNDGKFPLMESIDFLRNNFGGGTIIFWHEISSDEYEHIYNKY